MQIFRGAINPMTLDELDHAILNLLEQNGRMSNREVGRALNISEGTVRLRLKKLVENKAMRLGLVTDMEATGYQASAHIRIKVVSGSARQVADEIAKLDSCTFSALTLGRFDIIAVFVAKTRADIADIVENQVGKIKGIGVLDIQEPIGIQKHRYELVYIT